MSRRRTTPEVRALVIDDELSARLIGTGTSKAMRGAPTETWAVHPHDNEGASVLQVQLFKSHGEAWAAWTGQYIRARDRELARRVATARNTTHPALTESKFMRNNSQQDDSTQAGAVYADDQINGAYFMDWVRDQLIEASEMDPDKVLPLETKADARVIARNMLNQLEHDAKRDRGARGADDPRAFFAGFSARLREPGVIDWLADELLTINGGLHGGGGRVYEARRGRGPGGDKPKYRPSKGAQNLKVVSVVPDAGGAHRVEFDDDFSVQVHGGSGRDDLLYAMKPVDWRYEGRQPGPERRRDYQAAALRAVLGDRQADLVVDSDGDVMAHIRDGGGGGAVGEAPTKPVDDPFYIIQGLYNDGSASGSFTEFGFDDENAAIDEAKAIANSDWFEGDHVRVITRDGELVWSRRVRPRYGSGGVGEAPPVGERRFQRRPEPLIRVYDIEAVFNDERAARKFEQTVADVLRLPLVGQYAFRGGYALVYGPADFTDYNELEDRLYCKLGNAVRARLIQRGGRPRMNESAAPATGGAADFEGLLRSHANIGDRQLRVAHEHRLGGPSHYYEGVYVDFINLPQGAGSGGNRAEAENNRVSFWIYGFNGSDPHAPPPSGKVRVEMSNSVLPREYRLRAKAGTPEAIARYLGEFLSRIVAEVPPRFTHTPGGPGMSEARRSRRRSSPRRR